MKLFARRHPTAWILLIAAALLVALAVLGLTSGEAYMPGRRGSSSLHILENKEPERFFSLVRFQLGYALLLVALSVVRLVPVEDFFVSIRRALEARVQSDRAPAPLWAYVFLFGFIALIVWIGWKTMYSE